MLAELAVALAAAAPMPTIVPRRIPFGRERKEQMAAYARRHYGIDSYRLRDPKVIVQHYTVTASFPPVYNTFAPNVPDPQLGELPGICAHYAIDRDGTIYELVRRSLMCRHTVGLNHAALGIEHVGFSDGEILSNQRQLAASLRLTRWLRCRYGIAIRDVIGHSESLRSRHHRERVARLRSHTHGDFSRPSMRRYRAHLARYVTC